jgi:hypothetical protein
VRDHPAVVDALIAAAFFALGVVSVRVHYDLVPTFRFATGIAVMALLTFSLAFPADPAAAGARRRHGRDRPLRGVRHQRRGR